MLCLSLLFNQRMAHTHTKQTTIQTSPWHWAISYHWWLRWPSRSSSYWLMPWCFVAVFFVFFKKTSSTIDALPGCQRSTSALEAQDLQHYLFICQRPPILLTTNTHSLLSTTQVTLIPANILHSHLNTVRDSTSPHGHSHSAVKVLTQGRAAFQRTAYLSRALCAWAGPMCRSFCHSHRFSCLGGGREEGRGRSASCTETNEL